MELVGLSTVAWRLGWAGSAVNGMKMGMMGGVIRIKRDEVGRKRREGGG